tara:strand:+ start:6269 stop:6496 length:228 start_codon:yes stop_codon:yes gene_type:complete
VKKVLVEHGLNFPWPNAMLSGNVGIPSFVRRIAKGDPNLFVCFGLQSVERPGASHEAVCLWIADRVCPNRIEIIK